MVPTGRQNSINGVTSLYYIVYILNQWPIYDLICPRGRRRALGKHRVILRRIPFIITNNTMCFPATSGKEWRIKQPTDECIHQKKHIQIQMRWNLILSSNNLDKSGIDYNYEGKISFCYVMGAKQTVFGTQMIQWVISQYYLTLYYRSEGKHLNQLVHDH